LEYGVYLVLYYAFNTSVRVAADASYLIAWGASFFLTRNFVFSHTKKVGSRRQVARQSTLYSILIGVNFLFNNFAVVWLSDRGIKPYFGKVVIICIIACWNFIIYKKVIFKADKSGVK